MIVLVASREYGFGRLLSIMFRCAESADSRLARRMGWSFYSFDSVMKNKLQFRGLNLIQRRDDRLKKFINIIEYTICERCFDIIEKPEVGWGKVRTVWRMKTGSEIIFNKNCVGAFDE
jgi:Txe/YoeB family toxin of Txe-Axe toxin-antitoxin module